MTHDTNLDAEQQAIRRSLAQWVRIEIGKGHPARAVWDAIEGEAAQIKAMREGAADDAD